ncbi:hypothetical protein [Nocardia africana]
MKLFNRDQNADTLDPLIEVDARNLVRAHLNNPTWDIRDGLDPDTVGAINRELRNKARQTAQDTARKLPPAGATSQCSKCTGTELKRRLTRAHPIGDIIALNHGSYASSSSKNVRGDWWSLSPEGVMVTEAIVVECVCGNRADVELPADWTPDAVADSYSLGWGTYEGWA